MKATSSPVFSNQTGVNLKLENAVRRHLLTKYRKPISLQSRLVFDSVLCRLRERKDSQSRRANLILDIGCGTGDSTFLLAERNPNSMILGSDKSSMRMGKAQSRLTRSPRNNVCFLQIENADLVLLLEEYQILSDETYLLYPNPWPKAEHLTRRWHAHPIFPHLIAISSRLILRTNWKIYAEEFATSLCLATGSIVTVDNIKLTSPPLSAFERKYAESGHALYYVSWEKILAD